jgi:2-polyprenyl-6-hydroxyphenyl methylase/3-demethylubiquinone-9 3-methyltransferase
MPFRLKRFRRAALATKNGRALRDWVAAFLPYQAIGTDRELWDTRFAEGAWDRLHGIDELARYSIIAGCIQFLTRRGRVLDVGCGEGVLSERLCSNAYATYLGIDLSVVAIGKANQTKDAQDSRREFLVADLESFTVDGKFDAIVFNECLYYLPAPAETLRRYEGFLAENGAMIVSMCDTVETRKIWAQITNRYVVRDSVAVSNHNGGRWIVKVLGPSRNPLRLCRQA